MQTRFIFTAKNIREGKKNYLKCLKERQKFIFNNDKNRRFQIFNRSFFLNIFKFLT